MGLVLVLRSSSHCRFSHLSGHRTDPTCILLGGPAYTALPSFQPSGTPVGPGPEKASLLRALCSQFAPSVLP